MSPLAALPLINVNVDRQLEYLPSTTPFAEIFRRARFALDKPTLIRKRNSKVQIAAQLAIAKTTVTFEIKKGCETVRHRYNDAAGFGV